MPSNQYETLLEHVYKTGVDKTTVPVSVRVPYSVIRCDSILPRAFPCHNQSYTSAPSSMSYSGFFRARATSNICTTTACRSGMSGPMKTEIWALSTSTMAQLAGCRRPQNRPDYESGRRHQEESRQPPSSGCCMESGRSRQDGLAAMPLSLSVLCGKRQTLLSTLSA